MKKLLLITNLYPNRYDPVAGIFVAHQVEELAKYYQVWVVSSCFPHPWRVEHTQSNEVKLTTVYFPSWARFFLTALLTYPVFVLPAFKRVYKKWQPDIIHVHNFRHIPELIWLKTWLDKLPQPQYLTLHFLSTHPNYLTGKPHIALYSKTLRKALSNWTHIFTVNSRLLDLVKVYTLPERVSVLGNAINEPEKVDEQSVDFIKSQLHSSSFKIIAVGFLFAFKGFAYLISAVHALNLKGFDVQLVIVGGGKERDNLSTQIQALNLKDKVILTGMLENPVVRSLYPLFDAFVLPSYAESFGIVYLEAMFAGLPAIGIHGQGIDGLFLDGKEALFANPQDSADLQRKIEYLIQNPELARAIAKAGCAKVKENFMLPKLIGNVRDVYERQ